MTEEGEQGPTGVNSARRSARLGELLVYTQRTNAAPPETPLLSFLGGFYDSTGQPQDTLREHLARQIQPAHQIWWHTILNTNFVVF